MRTFAFALLCTSMSAALAASAFADDPTPKPLFVLMDNTGDGSKVNVDVATIIPADRGVDAVLVQPSILGQYVAPNGLGGYGRISMSSLMFTGDTVTGTHEFGNLELGGLYNRVLSPNVDLGVRVGVVLPTANPSFIHLFGTLLARPADVVTAIPDTTWMRLGVSPTLHHGPVFLRADFGVDVPMVHDQGFDPLGHVNVGVGIHHHWVSATAEMQTLFPVKDDLGKIDSDCISTAGVAVRYQGKGISPFLGVSTPLNRHLRGEIVTVTAGLTIPL